MRNTVTTLFLGENDITEVPYNRLKSLIWLNLDGNKIVALEKGALPENLRTLSVSRNFLQKFPSESLSSLRRLQWLYLRGNEIEEIPEGLVTEKMRIEKADLAENHLKVVPQRPFNYSVCIRDLNLAFNDLKVLTSHSFAGLQTGRIILSYNDLKLVESKAFSGVENTLEYLDFDHNNLLNAPGALAHLKSLKYLYLSSNLLNGIPQETFSVLCGTLKALSLSGNRLTGVPSEALRNCSKLSHFNIAFNEIYDVEADDFAWGANVRNLVLSNNDVVNLKSRMFSGLRSLKELSLSFNPLRYLDSDAMVGLEGLESLELSFSLDRDILPFELLLPLVSLRWLCLDNNNLYTVPEKSFDSLFQLANINLEFNNIEAISVELFKASVHTKLKEIRLSNNRLTEIRQNTFQSLASLEVVSMSSNRIGRLETESFNDLRNATHINLSYNLIRRIAPRSFVNVPSLIKVELQNNLLTEFSFTYFENLSNPLLLNLSNNEISSCGSDEIIVNLDTLDLKYNSLNKIPKCLKNIVFLRRLFLDFNQIAVLDQNNFAHLISLEQLTLQKNNVVYIHKRAFNGLQNLQILDLSKNLISHLHVGQFSSMPKLRILDLSCNNIRYLPKDVFTNTLLEMIDLSNNSFSMVPSLSLSEVGFSLRHFSISHNNVDHVDSTTFPNICFLHYLNLGYNKLSILRDNVFTSLGLVQNLDLTSNPIRANFKELFHYAQNLKDLTLANMGITSVPHLPLPNLISLNLSHNSIDSINRSSLKDLKQLKHLDLSYNRLIHVLVFHHLPLLKSLDISHNPIKEIRTGTFFGLPNLQSLKLLDLQDLQRFDVDATVDLKILVDLSLEIVPRLKNFKSQLCDLLRGLKRLNRLMIKINEPVLDEQLKCLSSRKIRRLEITGRNLKSIHKDAFERLPKSPSLLLKITGTSVDELPPGLFAHTSKIAYLTIDLTNNRLQHLSPEIFYGNASTWRNSGAMFVSGEKIKSLESNGYASLPLCFPSGLLVADNPLICGCRLAWLGDWLRRWTRDFTPDEATCTDPATGVRTPVARLAPEDVNCHASALSAARTSRRTSERFVLVVVSVVAVVVGW